MHLLAHKTTARTGAGDGSLTQLKTGSGYKINYTYDGLKRLQTATVANSSDVELFKTAYAFRSVSGNQSSAQVQYRNVRTIEGDLILGYKYSYDALGNITQISQSEGSYYPLVKYTYDNQNQLTKETYYDGAGNTTANITKTITYTYDTAGNILSETKTVGTTTTTKNYTYSEGNWKDLLTQVGNTTISYDGGNPTNWYNGSKTYTGLTWTNGRQLTSVTVGSKTATYAYDTDGIRTQKTVDGVTHTYYTLNGKLMRESFPYSDTTIIMDFIYDESGKPFAVCYSKDGGAKFTPYFYATNLQGDVEGIFRVLKNGTTGLYEQKWYGRYTYDAWGNVTAYTAAGNSPGSTTLVYRNPIRYRGYVYDNETGWYYIQSRYYDPANHRFINADEAEYVLISAVNLNATNLFTYCGNNPVSNADNDGAFWDTVFDVVSLAFSVVDVISNPSDVGAWIGLAGDIIDLIPFVSGVGEAARAVNVADDILDAADDIHDAAKIADRVDDAGDALTTVGKIDNIDVTVDCCFVAGTVILAESGKIPIEEIQVGDYVWAWDEESGNVALKRVEDTFIRESSELVHIYVNGEEIIATPEHPFYTPVYGWTSAAHLRAGDILVLVNGEYVVVEKVQHELLEAPVKVYNFQVEDYHTYYVAEVSVLVHNSCGKTTGKFANNAEAARVADELGYKPTSSLSHGQKVYVNNKAPSDLKYISRDIDCHSGGAWKAASTIQGLGSKATRSGTYTRYLEYLCK